MAIKSIKHKGLSLLYKKGTGKGIEPVYADKAQRILAKLETAISPSDMDLPGYRLHPLKGDYSGAWSVTLGANWRIVFCFEGTDVYDVDLVDYH